MQQSNFSALRGVWRKALRYDADRLPQHTPENLCHRLVVSPEYAASLTRVLLKRIEHNLFES